LARGRRDISVFQVQKHFGRSTGKSGVRRVMNPTGRQTNHGESEDAGATPSVGARDRRGSTHFFFDSAGLPASDRVDMARDLAARLFGGCQMLPTNDPAFRARMWAVQAGDVLVGDGQVTSANFLLGAAKRSPDVASRANGDEEGVFWIYLSGGVDVRQGTVEGTSPAGSAFFMHAEIPGAAQTEGAKVIGINLPNKALRRAIGHDRHLEPKILTPGSPLLHLLINYVNSLRDLPNDIDPSVLTSVGTHLVDLVALALGPSRDAAEQAKLGGLKSARLAAVLRTIETGYTDPGFSVAKVAAELQLSVRYVQDILHETGASFAERVLELRLREAAELLGRAHITHRKVSDIAFSCGFNNLTYFHRAFRRRYGMTPAGARST